MKKYITIIIIVILLLLLINASALAGGLNQEASQPLLAKFLLWIVTGGSVVAISWIAERNAWFQKQSPDTKKYIQYVGSAALGIIALLVQNYVPTPILELISPYFAVLAGTFGMIFLNQVGHTNDPATYRNK